MQVSLTDKYLKSLKPNTERIEVSDTVRRGLRFRLSPMGHATWVYEKRVKGGPKRKHTLGEYPLVSIKDARRISAEIQVEADAGIDRVAIKEQEKLANEENRHNTKTVRHLFSDFYDLHVKNLRTAEDNMKVLWDNFGQHADTPCSQVTNLMLQDAIDKKARTAPYQANRLKAALSKLAKFARQRGYFGPDVGRDLAKAIKEQPRERELSLDEVRRIYCATFALGDTFGAALRLLLLTAQRRSEIAKLQWSEVNFEGRYLNLGAARTKNGEGHITHLCDASMAEIADMRALADEDAQYVFTTTGYSPISGFTKTKNKLNEVLENSIKDWRFHDFRTAFATTMCDLGEDEAVVDRVLNHKASGSAPSPVARIYNRAKKLKERRMLLDRWGLLVSTDAIPEDS
ncbi:tyrosine-type recombinase/integrase [Pseudooceanicola sp. MF1-13]|uniref:tyrosine-type recombinase/integrase n=1 Tax=Pseudooceanicola sp. MF1-13 TaxID=3379095 RepID=UPI00389283F1